MLNLRQKKIITLVLSEFFFLNDKKTKSHGNRISCKLNLT
jgi:hypothetical protein